MQIVGVDHRELGTGPQNVERWDVFRLFCTWLHLVLWYNAILPFHSSRTLPVIMNCRCRIENFLLS